MLCFLLRSRYFPSLWMGSCSTNHAYYFANIWNCLLLANPFPCGFCTYHCKVRTLISQFNAYTNMVSLFLSLVSLIYAFYVHYRLGTTPLMLAVLIGAAQNILSKGAKYSLFDPCKEMAYIPLGTPKLQLTFVKFHFILCIVRSHTYI